jgi:hypothetical protein
MVLIEVEEGGEQFWRLVWRPGGRRADRERDVAKPEVTLVSSDKAGDCGWGCIK